MIVPFLPLSLDRRSSTPLQRQIYDQIRAAILGGALPSGARVPSTREMAADLGGFAQHRDGGVRPTSGRRLPRRESRLGHVRRQGRAGGSAARESAAGTATSRAEFSSRGDSRLRAGRSIGGDPAFAADARDAEPLFPGIPALDEFPRTLWARMAARIVRQAPWFMLSYCDPAGYRPLREAIAEYLRLARAVRCTADQVIVTDGTQQAFDLTARVLLDPGDTAWVEDPGYGGVRGALQAAGVCCVPVPIDAEGISVQEGMARAPRARLICVSPSHQYPLGIIMPLPRRMALLELARNRGAWIVEDDYDSEFRYRGRPLASLQGLDEAGRVIYTGSFSKTLFPGLRLGYLVAPEKLVDTFARARSLTNRSSAGLEQFLAAEFLSEGHFARHVRRMRALYAERQQALVAAVERER